MARTSYEIGSTGRGVARLQKALMAHGFPCGTADGIFGHGTAAAVRALQASEGLLVDGIAGAETLDRLGLKTRRTARRTTGARTKRKGVRRGSGGSKSARSYSATKVNRLFKGAKLRNIRHYLPAILRELEAANMDTPKMVMMALATVRAESAGFEPISEYRSKYNTSPGGHPFDLYDNRKDLGNRGTPDGDRYKGRGFIQLTGRANYRRIGKRIGLGTRLEREPELANEPDIAARILVAFLADKERAIKEALLENDLRRARRLVNGGSHGLANFRRCFRDGLKLFG